MTDLSTTSTSEPSAVLGEVVLRRGVLSGFEVLAQSVANLAPSAVIGVLIGYVAATAGAGAWVTWLIGTVVLVFVAVVISYVARRFTTTGGLYSLSANAAHPAFGHLTAWGALLAIVIGAPAVTIQFAIFFGQFLNLPAFGVPYNRWSILIIGLAVLLVTAWFSWQDIRLSARVMLVVELFSLAVIAVLMFVVLARHHGGLFQHSQLTLQGVTLNEVLLGVVLTIFAFSGFESATMLGQEARHPRRAIPVAVIGSVVIAGVFFVFTSYTIFLGFSGSKLHLATSSNPLSDVAIISGVSWYRYLVDIGVIVSMFSVIIAVYNAGSRYFLTLARERLAPSPFEKLSVHKTPYVGILFLGLANAICVVTVVAGNFNPVNAFGYIATLSGYGSSFMYIIFALSVGYFCLVKLRERSPRAIAIVVAVVVGAGGLAYALSYSFSPFPSFPLEVYLLIFCAVVALAGLTLLGIAWWAPQVLRRIGGSVASDTQLTSSLASEATGHEQAANLVPAGAPPVQPSS
jgi:amino acid transporter